MFAGADPSVSSSVREEGPQYELRLGGELNKEKGGTDTLLPPPGPPSSAASWALLVLTLQYLHANVCNFVIPALLPQVRAHLPQERAFN